MGIIDLFRPKWRHSDVDVRSEAVKHLGDAATLARVAQKDKDARVRKIALKRIDDVAVLEGVAANDPDQGVRKQAGEKASDLLVSQAVGGSAAALARLKPDRALAEVAQRAASDEIRKQALARVGDERVLLDVARKAEAQDTRLLALERIRDAALLRELALGEENKAVALAALARVVDVAALEEIAKNSKVKAARTAARERLPSEPEAPRQASAGTRPADKTRRALLLQLAVAAEAAAARSDWDAAAAELEELRGRLADVAGADVALERRFEEALRRFDSRRQADAVARARVEAKKAEQARVRAATKPGPAPAPPTPAPAPAPAPEPVVAAPPPAPVPTAADRLQVLVLEIERHLDGGKVNDARLADLDRRFGELGDAPDELKARYSTARETLGKRVADEKARRDAKVAEARAKLERATGDVERALAGDSVKAAESAQRTAQAALKLAGADADGEARERLRVALDKLTLRLAELRDADSWRRWANVPKLEELCREAEALAQVLSEVEDKRRAPALLKELQERWKAVGAAPKEKHEPLWTRFKAACDAVYEKYKDYFGKLDEERGGNLTKKEELCAQVEALAESTDWKETAEKIKQLQEQWKAIGPVPQDKADAVWKRFRAACDAFFDRRKAQDKERDGERAANLERKVDLAAKVEALAQSTDWKETAAAIKRYQEDWQQIGPASRAEGDAVWKRFRAACDAFFERRKAAFEKLDEERQANLKAKLLLCERAEALASADDHEAALAAVKELQADWKATGPVPKDQSDELWRRFRTACDVVYAGPPVEAAAAAPTDGAGVSGFSNKLPLEGIAAKLAAQVDKKS